MVLHLEISNLEDDGGSKDKKFREKSLAPNCASYRGFTSIDQEMEREIAMQYFKPRIKNSFFHDVALLKNRM